jgi:hypothetical protein
MRWGRIALGVLVAEAAPIAALVALVAVFGPRVQAEAELFAARLGQWVGPLGGALMCFVMAVWVARPLESRRILHGAVLGALAALIDVSLLLVSGAAFQWVFVMSNVGRIVAGTLGGVVANRRPIPPS